MQRTIGRIDDDIRRLNNHAAALGHGIPRIEAEVHQDLMDLCRIGTDGPDTGRIDHLDLDSRVNGSPQQRNRFFHVSRQMQQRRLVGRPPAEGQELPGEFGGPAPGLFRLAEELGDRMASFQVGVGQ